MMLRVVRTTHSSRRALAFGAALLPIVAACDITSPSQNNSPSVRIEEIVIDGYDPATATIFIHVTDPDSHNNDQLSHGDYFLNGTHEGTIPLSGSEVRTSFRLPRLSPDAYSLEITVYDRAGSSGSAVESFTVSSEPRRATVEVYVNRIQGIERLTEGELCLSDDCAPINSEGIARFDSLSNSGHVVVKIPEQYHPMFLVSLGDRRSDKNIIDYTNADYLNGRNPIDTLLTKGENYRRLIFFEHSSKWQDILDDHSSRSLQYYNDIFRFMHPGGTLNVYVSTASGMVSDSLANRIWHRTQEAVDHANGTYESIPWRDPQPYILQTGMTSTPVQMVKFGDIALDPHTRYLFRCNAPLLDDRNVFELGAFWCMLDSSHRFGERGVEHFAKYFVLTFLSGILHPAPSESGRFTQEVLSEDSLLHEVVEDDLLAMRLFSMYGPGTRYLSTAEINAGLLSHPRSTASAPTFK
jgi:hypothetical protein